SRGTISLRARKLDESRHGWCDRVVAARHDKAFQPLLSRGGRNKLIDPCALVDIWPVGQKSCCAPPSAFTFSTIASEKPMISRFCGLPTPCPDLCGAWQRQPELHKAPVDIILKASVGTSVAIAVAMLIVDKTLPLPDLARCSLCLDDPDQV